MQEYLALMEPVFEFIESKTIYLYGFTMVGVLLVLVGIQKITKKDLLVYLRERRYLNKKDHVIAWGIFYIIFGILISISSILTVTLYL